MNYHLHTAQRPAVQLLITACPQIGDVENGYSWLHGYCLLTCSQLGGAVRLDGQLRIGQPYCENYDLIAELTDALDPRAVLGGLDLHDMVSSLSRLPIGTQDQGPALALLAKLQAMLCAHRPIDLALDRDHESLLVMEVLEHKLSCSEGPACGDGFRIYDGVIVRGDLDNGNPHRLVQNLVDTASAAMLALGDLYLPDELQPKLLAEWRAWRHSLAPAITRSNPALAIVSSN